MDTIFSNIALMDVPSVKSSVSDTNGSEVVANSSGNSTASALSSDRAIAIADANKAANVKKSGDILPSTVQMDTLRDTNVLQDIEDVVVPEIDAMSLIYEQCHLSISDVEDVNVSEENETASTSSDDGTCDKSSGFFSCGGVQKTPVKGGGFIKSTTLESLTSTILGGVSKFVNGQLEPIANAVKEAREIGCALNAGMAMDMSDSLDIASATPAGKKAIASLSARAASKGNVKYLSKMSEYMPISQINKVAGENGRAIFSNALSNSTPSKVSALDNIMPDWDIKLEPGMLDNVTTTNFLTDDQERAVLITQVINHSDIVTA